MLTLPSNIFFAHYINIVAVKAQPVIVCYIKELWKYMRLLENYDFDFFFIDLKHDMGLSAIVVLNGALQNRGNFSFFTK